MTSLQFAINMYIFFIFLSSATIGISHPDIVVETNTLSSVPPPDITYTLSIPEKTINCGLLSALQLEAIIYACQVHAQDHTHAGSQYMQFCYNVKTMNINMLIMHLCSCAYSWCTISNTRLSFRTTREQAS